MLACWCLNGDPGCQVWLFDTTQKQDPDRCKSTSIPDTFLIRQWRNSVRALESADMPDSCARAFVLLHVHTAEPWERAVQQAVADRDWSHITQINIRHTSGTTPFVERNPELGKASGWSGKQKVFGHHR